jgi:DNA-binding HxlR family transcriptional regulator
MKEQKIDVASCPSFKLMQLLGSKWVLIVLNFLAYGILRFKELESRIGSISPKMLTSVLETLENEGLVSRTVSSSKPLKVEYALTDKGKLIVPLLEEIQKMATHLELKGK